MNNMELVVDVKSNYGVKMIYPINETAKLFADLIGQKTLTIENIALIKKLGYSVTAKKNEVSL